MSCGNGSINTVDENAFNNALEDLKTVENASNSDVLLTPSRLNGDVRTLQGRLQEIAGFIAINGGVWDTAIVFNGYEEFMIYNGSAYKPKAATVLPLASTAIPDVNDFEPFSIATTQGEIIEDLISYNVVTLGDFTDYVFASSADMATGTVIGGDIVTFKEGQGLKVNGENNEVSCYIVETTLPGLALAGGLFAKEVFAKVSDTSGSLNNPIATLNPLNDARNFPVPALSMINTVIPGLSLEFGGGVLSQSNKIYAAPIMGSSILKIDISQGNAVSEFGSVASGQGYTSCALAIDGFLYSASTGGDKILKINTVNDSASELVLLNPSNIGFDGIISADNGLLYLVPSSATQVVEFDTDLVSVTYIGDSYSADPSKWAGGCIAPNGKIYCAPHDDNNILEIDPVTKTTRLIPISSTASFAKWKGCVLGNDGIIYFIPHNATEIMKYDSVLDSVSYTTGLSANSNKYAGGVLGANGRIYFMPYSEPEVLEINTDSGEMKKYAFETVAGTNKFYGGVSSVDGVIYGMPSNGDDKILVIDGIEGSINWQISAYSNKY